MGSSTTGKKHKKEKKHKKHRSLSVSDDEEPSRSSHRHHHKHKKHKEDPESKDHYRKHKHHHHHHHHHHRHSKDVSEYDDSKYGEDVPEPELGIKRTIYCYEEGRKRERERERPRDSERERERRGRTKHDTTTVIDVQESDSDSSDCVEVPLAPSPIPKAPKKAIERQVPPPPPPNLSTSRETRENVGVSRRYDRKHVREESNLRREVREDSRRDEREESRRRIHDITSSRQRERQTTPPQTSSKGHRATQSPPRPLKRKHVESDNERDVHEDVMNSSKSKRKLAPPPTERRSPVPENGAGDVLSIEETNKLRAKLGLKPLEVNAQISKPVKTSSSNDRDGNEAKKGPGEKDLSKYKDEWGEFLHKPAENLKQKAEAEKIREKLKQHKEKRFLEERLQQIRTLGESDEEVDDVSKWVQRSKRVVDEKKEAQRRAKALEEMDAEFGVDNLVKNDEEKMRRKAYSDKHLKGLRVEHDIEDFSEGRTVILTLKDNDVLNENNGDTLVNVNMIDNERYRRNVKAKKQNPQTYGYDVYEEQYDQFGNFIERGVLAKYDEDLDGKSKKNKNFIIGEDLQYQKEQKRKLLELQTKLAGKRLETLDDVNLTLASDTFSEAELTKFKKPKKKVRKIRQKLKADDLLPLNGEEAEQHFGSRHGRSMETENNDSKPDMDEIRIPDDEDDLERVLNKARRLRQKENLIKKPLLIDGNSIKQEIKTEEPDVDADCNIVLNATAEFCRTLGDIPTYGMSGNRNVGENDRIDYEEDAIKEEPQNNFKNDDEVETQHGTWNSVNPDDVLRPVELDVGNGGNGDGIEDVAILDEEPDVGAGVANALRLALSKGYLEKEERKRPSNSKMAHLQAKNYSIEDKSAADDEKIGRRDRYHAGPIMDFKDKDNFKPNVKLEYIDDNGRILNLKEAFRYLSHKFHGKGPGKNKIEKRLKKMEQDGLMKTMSSTDTPLRTLTMLQQKQKETKTPYVVLSGGKQLPGTTTISKYK